MQTNEHGNRPAEAKANQVTAPQLAAEKAWIEYLDREKMKIGMPGLMPRPSFIAGYGGANAIAFREAIDAINGVIAYGRMGIHPPPEGHWLTEYWAIGQQLAELGKTSAWDNHTPVEASPSVIEMNDAQLLSALDQVVATRNFRWVAKSDGHPSICTVSGFERHGIRDAIRALLVFMQGRTNDGISGHVRRVALAQDDYAEIVEKARRYDEIQILFPVGPATAFDPHKTADHEHVGTNHQGATAVEGAYAGRTGQEGGSGADEHNEHRSGQADADQRQHQCNRDGAGVRGACDIPSTETLAALHKAEQRAKVFEVSYDMALEKLVLSRKFMPFENVEAFDRAWDERREALAKASAEKVLREGSMPVEVVPAEVHPDDAAVDRFAAAMKEKLARAREKGRRGWEQCDPVELSIMLREHVEKGDPRDVANFCMFLWSLGKPIGDAALPYGKRCAEDGAEPVESVPIQMRHEPENRAMWHENCPSNARFAQPMKPLIDVSTTSHGEKLRIWECVACGAKAWHGYSADGQQITECIDKRVSIRELGSWLHDEIKEEGAVAVQQQDLSDGCTRSHPHENMNAACQQKAEEARAGNLSQQTGLSK